MGVAGEGATASGVRLGDGVRGEGGKAGWVDMVGTRGVDILIGDNVL